MGKFNTTTVMLLDEDIKFKQDNARRLMIEDITDTIIEACGNIEFKQTHHMSYMLGVIQYDEIVCNETGVHVVTEKGHLSITQMDYEEVKSVYNALKSEGYFNNN